MLERWAKVFADPEDGSPLTLSVAKAEGEDVLEGSLQGKSGRRWPIKGGVPRFVPENFYKEEEPASGEKTQTVRSFSAKWTNWEKTAGRLLGQTAQEKKDLAVGLAHIFGLKSAAEAQKKLFKAGARVLDAGCGVGWGEELFNDEPRCERFGVDISRAAEVAYARTKKMPNVCIAQGDLLRPPFSGPTFDAIFSSGVIHHTGDARKAFSKLAGLLKPGGTLGVYVYAVKPLIRELSDVEIRKKTTELSYAEALEFSDQISKLGRSFSKIKTPLVVEKDAPLLGIKKGKYSLQKFMYDHFIRCWWNARMGLEFANLVNVDWWHPKFASHHTQDEVEGWFAENGLKLAKIHSPRGWETSGYFAAGRRP